MASDRRDVAERLDEVKRLLRGARARCVDRDGKDLIGEAYALLDALLREPEGQEPDPCPDPDCTGHLVHGDRGECSECGAAYVWSQDKLVQGPRTRRPTMASDLAERVDKEVDDDEALIEALADLLRSKAALHLTSESRRNVDRAIGRIREQAARVAELEEERDDYRAGWETAGEQLAAALDRVAELERGWRLGAVQDERHCDGCEDEFCDGFGCDTPPEASEGGRARILATFTTPDGVRHRGTCTAIFRGAECSCGAGAPPSPEEPLELMLCEASRLHLRPDTLYRFTVDPDCEACGVAECEADISPPEASEEPEETVVGIGWGMTGADYLSEGDGGVRLNVDGTLTVRNLGVDPSQETEEEASKGKPPQVTTFVRCLNCWPDGADEPDPLPDCAVCHGWIQLPLEECGAAPSQDTREDALREAFGAGADWMLDEDADLITRDEAFGAFARWLASRTETDAP